MENKQGDNKPTIDKEYLKKLAEKIKADKARRGISPTPSVPTGKPPVPPKPPVAPVILDDDDAVEEMASEKTAIIDLSSLTGSGASARLVIIDGKDEGKSLDITRDEVFVGRSLDNDFVVSDISVSRKHFKVVKNGEGYSVQDLGSGNGIRLNGKKVTEEPLFHGDVISAGARNIKIEYTNDNLRERFSRKSETVLPKENIVVQKSGSSKIAWVAIFLVLVLGAGMFYVFMTEIKPQKSLAQKGVTVEDIDKIDELIDSKKLLDAEKGVYGLLQQMPDNKYLIERKARIDKEKSNQKDFEEGKKLLISSADLKGEEVDKKKAEAYAFFKKIAKDSIFFDDMKKLAGEEPVVEWAIEEVNALYAQKKNEEAIKEIANLRFEYPENEKIKQLFASIGDDKEKVKKIFTAEVAKKVAVKKAKEERKERIKKVAEAPKPVIKTIPKKTAPVVKKAAVETKKPEPKEEAPAVKTYSTKDIDEAINIYNSKDFDAAIEKLEEIGANSKGSVKQNAVTLKNSIKKFSDSYSQYRAAFEFKNKIAPLENCIKLDKTISKGALTSKSLNASLFESYAEAGKQAESENQYNDAAKYYQGALKLDNNNSGLKAALKRVQDKAKEESAKTQQPSEEDEMKAKQLYMEGKVIAGDDPEQARKKFKEVLKLVPEGSKYYKKAESALKKLK